MKAKWEKIDVPYEAWEDYDWDYKMNGLEWDGYDIKTKTHPIWVWKWFIVVQDRMNRSGWLIYDGLFDIVYSSSIVHIANHLMKRQKGRYGYNRSIKRKEKPLYAPFTNKKKWGDKEGHQEYYLYELALSNILRQVARERIIDQYGDYEKGVEVNKAKVGRYAPPIGSIDPELAIELFKTTDGYNALRTKWVAQRICEYIYGWQLKYSADQCLLNHSYIWRYVRG